MAGRPKNSLSRKFGIKLSDLCQILQPDTIIPVSRTFFLMIKQINNTLQIVEIPTEVKNKKEEKIDFTIN